MAATIHIFIAIIAIVSIAEAFVTEQFSSPNVDHFGSFLFSTANDQLIVGARDTLLQFNLQSIAAPTQSYHLPATGEASEACKRKGQPAELCHNFIRTLLPSSSATHSNPSSSIATTNRSEQVLICGTNAFAPLCSWRNLADLTIQSEPFDGRGKSPSSLHWNTTSLMVDGDVYYAGPLEFQGRDPEVFRSSSLPDAKGILRTVQYDYKWLNTDSHFIESFEDSSFVYFVFRESAVEFMNCGRTIYSRIARVCKNDIGGFRENIWSTFLKARLNCSLPGQFPFYFDLVQDATFFEADDTLYGIFSTPDNSIHGSAVCSFQLSSVNRAFKGPLKLQRNSYATWEYDTQTDDLKDQFFCQSTKSDYDARLRRSNEQQKYQLLFESVQATNGQPFLIDTSEKLLKLAVDKLKTKYNGEVQVLFILTEKNALRRYAIWPYSTKACLIDETQISQQNDTVLTFKLHKDSHSLFIGTKHSIFRVALSQCDKYSSELKCLRSSDPYCGWNSKLKKCTAATPNTVEDFWVQARSDTSCTDSQLSQWSSWSKWERCKVLNKSEDESCLCRYRKCTGVNCERSVENQVTNCTVHGGWTNWLEWSSCSATCGKAVKTRIRTCTNPTPMFGGRQCSGPRRETVECPFVPCPTTTTTESPLARHYQWSDWHHWTECSAKCGGGHRQRRRQCLALGGECIGCPVEWEECNTEPCEEALTKTDWTNWYLKNDSTNGGGLVEERQKFICRATNVRANDLQISTRKEVRPIEQTDRQWSECVCQGSGGVQFYYGGLDAGYIKRPCSEKCTQATAESTPTATQSRPSTKWGGMLGSHHNVSANSVITSEWSQRMRRPYDTIALLSYCLTSWLVGLAMGLAAMWLNSKRKTGFAENRHLRLTRLPFPANSRSNTYVTNDEFKLNSFHHSSSSPTTNLLHYSTLPTPSKLNKLNSNNAPKEATIKRTSTIRAKLTNDSNF